MSWLSSFLNPGRGYENSQDELNKHYQEGQGYLQPYNQHGLEQYGTLLEFIDSLKNPGNLLDKFSNGYQESDYAKNQEQIAQEHGLNAATALGLNGSNTALNAIQRGTSQIGMQDKENYLNRILDTYIKGAGLSSGLYNTGANMASNLSNNASRMGEDSANLSFGRENAGGNTLGTLLGLIGGLGTGALKGPIGGALAKRWNFAGGR
jgi:hypothetical protein